MLCAGLQMRPDVLLLRGPCLHQGENGLPDFTEAAAQRAADMNLLQSFLPDPHCFLGLPRELRARAEPPGPLSSLEVGRTLASPQFLPFHLQANLEFLLQRRSTKTQPPEAPSRGKTPVG